MCELRQIVDFCKKNRYLDSHIDLLKVLLSELLITHFDIIKYQTIQNTLHLYFEENKAIPEEFSKDIVIAHGFHKEIIVEDFPLRGKTVLLHIKRRRWLNKTTQKVVYRNWNLVAQGNRMTIEFAVFLKAISSLLMLLTVIQQLTFIVSMEKSYNVSLKIL